MAPTKPFGQSGSDKVMWSRACPTATSSRKQKKMSSENAPTRGPRRTAFLINARYHAPGNQFARFRGFLELISRLEFDFCRCGNYYFFERFEFFGVFKFQTHTQCGRTCACAVACWHTHNSISNVVVSVIHDDKCIHMYMKPLWKVKGFCNRTSWKASDMQIVRKTWVLSSFSVSVSLCLCLCLCRCVLLMCSWMWCSWLWLWWWWREGRRREGERPIEPSGPKFPSRLLKLNSLKPSGG